MDRNLKKRSAIPWPAIKPLALIPYDCKGNLLYDLILLFLHALNSNLPSKNYLRDQLGYL